MWIYLSGSDGLPPVVLYDSQPGRGGKYAKVSWKALLVCSSLTDQSRNRWFRKKQSFQNWFLPRSDWRIAINYSLAKSYTIGRKSLLFIHRKPEPELFMYSIIETAKKQQPGRVPVTLHGTAVYADCKNGPAGIEMLLPWSEFIKGHCSGLIGVGNITPEKHDPLPI